MNQNQDTLKVTLRDVAKLLCTDIPESDYTQAVNTTLETVKSLPEQTKLSMRIAYIFASKVPYDDRLDCFQDFTATLLKSGIDEPKLAYSVIRGDWLDWWKASKIHAHIDLDTKIETEESDVTSLGESAPGRKAASEGKQCKTSRIRNNPYIPINSGKSSKIRSGSGKLPISSWRRLKSSRWTGFMPLNTPRLI